MTEKTDQTALTQATTAALVKSEYGIDVQRAVAMRAAVVDVMKRVMKKGIDYGEIPGTTKEGEDPKLVLKQSGGEILCQVFRLRPEFHEMTVIERDDFIYYKNKCKLFNSVTGEFLGEAIGSANTREDKYVKQCAARICPKCEKPTIFKSKRPPYGWFCWIDKGGCGAQFAEEDKAVIDQTGAINSNKVWGLHHTIVSMAQKRPYVRAIRNVTGCSDLFTDEDAPPDDDEHGQPGNHAPRTAPKPATSAPKAGMTDVQKLISALIAAEIGTVDTSLPEAEQKEQAKRAKLGWVNGHLEDVGEAKVTSVLELTPAQVKWLIEKAEKGECPQGW